MISIASALDQDTPGRDAGLPWTERHRPQSLGDMVGNADVVSQVQRVIDAGDVPNLLFVGDPGTGKTSAALCVARAHMERALDVAPAITDAAERRVLFAKLWRAHVLMINASEERGIQTVRTKVKTFAQYASARRVSDARLYKLVLFDDCDHLTPEAQASLRRLTEEHAPSTRFLFTCCDPSRLIQALQSRCLLFALRRVPNDAMSAHLARVAHHEGVQCTDAAFASLADVARGDVRRGVATLQAVAAFCAARSSTEGARVVRAADVERLFGVEPTDDVNVLLAHVFDGRADDALRMAQRMMHDDGMPVADLLETMYAVVSGTDVATPPTLPGGASASNGTPDVHTTVGSHADGTSGRSLAPTHVRETLAADGLLRIALLHDLTVAQERARRGLTTPMQWSGLVARMCNAAARSRARARANQGSAM